MCVVDEPHDRRSAACPRGAGSHAACHGGGYDIRRLRRRERNEAHAVGVVRVSRTRHLDREPRLAYATGADERAAARRGGVRGHARRPPRAPRSPWWGGHPECRGRSRVGHSARLSEGPAEVLPQDQAVKPLKVGQVDPQLGDEALARVAEGRSASAWRPIGTGRALADRERAPAEDAPGRAHEAPRQGSRGGRDRDPRRSGPRARGDAEIFEPPDLGLRKRFVAEVGERRPTPQRESSLESVVAARAGSPAASASSAGGGHVLEALEVELAAVQPERIPGMPVSPVSGSAPVAGPARAFAAGATPLPAGRLWRREAALRPTAL